MRVLKLIEELVILAQSDPHAEVCIDGSIPTLLEDEYAIELGKGMILFRRLHEEEATVEWKSKLLNWRLFRFLK